MGLPTLIPGGRSSLSVVRRAVEELRRLRREMAQRQGFKQLSDKEIKDAKNTGRP